VAFWLSNAEGRVTINHLSQAKGRRVEGAGASVPFKITGSQEPYAVGACMRVLEFNFNVEVQVVQVPGTQNWLTTAPTMSKILR
jgi:hypothetical protein